VLRLCQDNRGRHKLSPLWEGPTSSSRCSGPARTSWRTSRVKCSPTLGTSNSYVASTLRKDFQVLLCIPNAPVGYIYVKVLLNKVKGDSAFSLKTKTPSGGYYGGHPQMVLLFSQKSLLQKALSMSQPGSLVKKMRDANDQRTKTGESGIAHTSGRIRPFPLTTSPTSYS
jgi:hypothetical protein